MLQLVLIVLKIYDTNIKTDTSVVTTFDSYLADLVQEVYNQKANDWIKRRKADGKEYTLDTIPTLKKESLLNSARQHVLATYDIMDNDGVRLSLLKVLLNHTIYNHSMNAIFNGDIEEYKDTCKGVCNALGILTTASTSYTLFVPSSCVTLI